MSKFLLTIFILFLPLKAFANSCPILIKEIDKVLEETKQISKEQLIEIKQLRDQGEKAHKEGDHKESEELLKQALDLLDS